MNLKKKIRLLRQIFKLRLFEKIVLKFTNNKNVFSFYGKIIPSYTSYQKGAYRIFKRDGIKMRVDISDYIGYMAYFGFTNETIPNFYKLIADGMNILDIGSNIGFVLLNISKRLGSRGKVFGFEPDAENFKVLRENVELNTFKNIEIFNYGLGDISSVQKLYRPTDSNLGANRINNDVVDNFSYVKIQKLDTFIENKKIKIDLVKIDVEGFEYKVLLGAENFIKTQKPIFYIELDDNNLKQQGDSAKKLIQLLGSHGYSKIINANENEIIKDNYTFENKHFDIICFPS